MPTLPRTSTSEMEVTSIRLERELKNQLKRLAGGQGYQVMVRNILWNYVQQKSGQYRSPLVLDDIRSSVDAIARKEERCAITGDVIRPNEPMLLGLTAHGDLVPLSMECLAR
ncbi:MAG: hypothetical protein GDA48_16725 [Hormoscilla sp. GM102CHS1]|nr:hypothetical protein [Hormoscilla sp. SP12CHS1]MBC6474248.1 hypothetical protein [Hormoscilla sp. GM102CHS1]